jgi:hypothetical protein
MWRRIAGGLGEEAQAAIWDYLRPHLERRVLPDPPKGPKLKGVQPEGLDEMVRAAASLEHLDPDAKVELGSWITERLSKREEPGGPWAWSLGRLAARAPIYGSVHKVVPPEIAEGWLSLLLERGLTRIEGAPFAAAQIARLTGDRARDLSPELRRRTAEALEAAKVPERWRSMVNEVLTLEAQDEARALGDTLPGGLKL